MRIQSAVACMHFLEVDGFCHNSTTNGFINCFIDVLYIISVSFLYALELPFRDNFMGIARSIGNDSFQNCALTAVGVFHTLLVGYLPIIVRRVVALADNTTKVTTLTGVELAIYLAIHLLSTMCHAHRAVFIHRGEHRA